MRYLPRAAAAGRWLSALTLLVSLMSGMPPVRPASAVQHAALLLPVILRDAGPLTPEQTALERINRARGLAGVRLIQLHPALIHAAQRHASYTVVNASDPSAWTYGPHGEVTGKPGFSGRMPGDRADAAGYPALGGWEVMDYLGDPVQSVDHWLGTVYHRLIVLDPQHEHLGYGRAQGASGGADVADFGHATAPIQPPDVVVYPAAGQMDVPLLGVAEAPDPLPPGASGVFGYPVTLQPIAGGALSVAQAVLRDGAGHVVALYPNPTNCATACYAILPAQPLLPATMYTAHVAGSVEGVPFDKVWSFTTVAGAAAGARAR